MSSRGVKKSVSFFLALGLTLLCACGGAPETGEGDGGGADYTGSDLGGQELTQYSAADDVFSLNCDFDQSFSPYVTTNADNLLVDQLVYENIVELDDDYGLTSRVITSWESVDGQYWYFKVDTSILFQDGSSLTAKDVSYSIQQAMRSSKYASRFRHAWGASSSGEDSFAVSLNYADEQFMSLLTVPIIKYGSVTEKNPLGTGPYKFAEDGKSLEKFDGHPDCQELPMDRIYLVEYDTTEKAIRAYEDSYIDLVVNDPSGITDLGYGGNNEVRYFTTTNMHYLGVNMKSPILQYVQYRYALLYAVDRDYDTKTLMQGAGIPAALPISPNSPLYNEELAADYAFDLEKTKQILANGNVMDHDADGKLEILMTGIPMELELNLIVCNESTGKVDVARKFADDLGSIGLTVTVHELSWTDYQNALLEGEFDLYYGELKMKANFDLTSLFVEEGTLNYCAVEDETYMNYIGQFLAAKDDARQQCCDIMCKYILDTAALIPICFERQEVITHRNVISGIEPNQYNVFYNFKNWVINQEGAAAND